MRRAKTLFFDIMVFNLNHKRAKVVRNSVAFFAISIAFVREIIVNLAVLFFNIRVFVQLKRFDSKENLRKFSLFATFNF